MPIKPKIHSPFISKEKQLSTDRSGQYSDLYTTRRWRAIRYNQLAVEPLCMICKKNGIDKEATICDHIEPHRGDMYKFWNGPFQSLCKRCHDSNKQGFEKGKGQRKIGIDGYPI